MSKYYEQQGVAMTCRGFDEYVRMFSLTLEDLNKGELLDAAAGASSFTAEANRRGIRSHAADPRYALAPDDVHADAALEIETSTAKLAELSGRMDFSYYGSLENHRAMREASLALFSKDFASADKEERYSPGALPDLPFETGRFGLVLCSHFLFLYAEQFGYEFHLQAVRELLRVCRPGGQVRIYPLVSLRYEPYSGMEQLMADLQGDGISAERMISGLPFIPGSTELLKLSKKSPNSIDN
jgi:SAM-dependent methyltransferase